MQELHSTHGHNFPEVKDYGNISEDIIQTLGLEKENMFIIIQKLGLTLKELLIDAHHFLFTLKDVVKIGVDLLHQVELMHDAGFIHCDIKVDNVMIDLESAN